MKPIIQLLKEMRGRLPMYVGTNSISKLAMFLRGYSYALEKHGLSEDDAFLSSFQEMVQTRYDVKVSRTWEDIILFQSADDYEAVATFWRLFDEYIILANALKESDPSSESVSSLCALLSTVPARSPKQEHRPG